MRFNLLLCLSVVCSIRAWAPNVVFVGRSADTDVLDKSSHVGGVNLPFSTKYHFIRNREATLYAFGGFGGTGDKQKKEAKLKPKQQWDRFLDLKKENKIRVAVRVSEDGEWLEVGNVRSKESKYTEYALAKQRALIAEHARRLFPLQITPRDTVTWAYWNEDSDQWIVLEKEVLEKSRTESPGLEKLIGFEGRPDPSSGFYCVYNEGRRVGDTDDARPSSKRLK
ncbi:hypothetical protein ACA910_017061 [Epithemia clementina (nom. ined.)]